MLQDLIGINKQTHWYRLFNGISWAHYTLHMDIPTENVIQQGYDTTAKDSGQLVCHQVKNRHNTEKGITHGKIPNYCRTLIRLEIKSSLTTNYLIQYPSSQSWLHNSSSSLMTLKTKKEIHRNNQPSPS